MQANRSLDAQGFDPAQASRWGLGLDPGEPEFGENASESAAYNSLVGLGMSGGMMGGTRRKKKPVLLLDPEEAQNAYRQMAVTAAHDFENPDRAERFVAPAPVLAAPDTVPFEEAADFAEEEAFTEDYFTGNGADDALARWLPKDFGKLAQPAPPPVVLDEEDEAEPEIDFAWAADDAAPAPEAECAAPEPTQEEEWDAVEAVALARWTPASFGGGDAVQAEPEPAEEPSLAIEPEWLPPQAAAPAEPAPPVPQPAPQPAAAAEPEWTQQEAVPGVALFPKHQSEVRGTSLRARYVKQPEPRPSALGKLFRWLLGRLN